MSPSCSMLLGALAWREGEGEGERKRKRDGERDAVDSSVTVPISSVSRS